MKELSEKNNYYVPKHRYYELLHFCRQYDDYLLKKKQIMDEYIKPVVHNEGVNNRPQTISHVENFALKLVEVDEKIEMIEQAAVDADKELSGYILMAVSGGIGYDSLSVRYGIPCSRNTFYDRYRKFFWLLDKRRR